MPWIIVGGVVAALALFETDKTIKDATALAQILTTAGVVLGAVYVGGKVAKVW
jgi:hypothetical protein